MGNYGVLQVLGVLGNTGGLIESTVGYCRVLQGTAGYCRYWGYWVILGANREYCGILQSTAWHSCVLPGTGWYWGKLWGNGGYLGYWGSY